MREVLRRALWGALFGATGGLVAWYCVWACDGQAAPWWKYATVPAVILAFVCGPISWATEKSDIHASV